MISSSLLAIAALATPQRQVQTADFPVSTWVTLREIRDEAVLLKSQVPAVTTLGSSWTPTLSDKAIVYRFPGPQRTMIVEDSFLFQNELLVLASLLKEDVLPALSQPTVVELSAPGRRALITFALSRANSKPAAETLYLLLNRDLPLSSFRVCLSPAVLDSSGSARGVWITGFDRIALSGYQNLSSNSSAQGLSIYSTLPILGALVDLRLLEEQLVAISGRYRKPSARYVADAVRLRALLAESGTAGFANLLSQTSDQTDLVRLPSSVTPDRSAQKIPLGFAIRVQHPLDPSGRESIAILPWAEL